MGGSIVVIAVPPIRVPAHIIPYHNKYTMLYYAYKRRNVKPVATLRESNCESTNVNFT